MNINTILFATIFSLGATNALAVKSLLEYNRNVYCLHKESSALFPNYGKLKSVTGTLHYGTHSHSKEAIEVRETCAELVSQCKESFGPGYIYIQSGQSIAKEWDTVVDSDGAICQHKFADNH